MLALSAVPASSRLPWPVLSGERPSLPQCLTLALLIHVLLVLVVGNTPGGSARRGEGVWGALNIRLVGGDAGGQPEATVAAEADTGPEGAAAKRRWGGAVRPADDLPAAAAPPGAARQGPWRVQARDGAPDRKSVV